MNTPFYDHTKDVDHIHAMVRELVAACKALDLPYIVAIQTASLVDGSGALSTFVNLANTPEKLRGVSAALPVAAAALTTHNAESIPLPVQMALQQAGHNILRRHEAMGYPIIRPADMPEPEPPVLGDVVFVKGGGDGGA